MPNRSSALPEYVVELDVRAIAVLSVHAESADDACSKAESQVRPADVTEVGDVETLRVVRVGDELRRVYRTRGRRSAQTAAKGSGDDGQA